MSLSRSNKVVPVLVWAVVVVVLALFVVTATGLPVTNSIGYGCPYCGAHLSRLQVLGLTVKDGVKASDLTRYWLKNVDPHHTHTWVRLCGNYNMGFGATYDSPGWTHERWQLKDDVALAVLKALPSAKERKQFMGYLWGKGVSMPKTERDTRALLIHELKVAHYDNPNRSDWLALLKKHGYK